MHRITGYDTSYYSEFIDRMAFLWGVKEAAARAERIKRAQKRNRNQRRI